MAKRRQRSRPVAPSAGPGKDPSLKSPRKHEGHGRREKPKGPARTKRKGSPAVSELSKPPALRVGHGYDLHRLEALAPAGSGRPFVLGGVNIDADGAFGKGPVAHSDGDVLLHAVTDALLGALGQEDIGQLFPDTAEANKSRDSKDFLLEAVSRVGKAGYIIGNLDCTVILERPKLSPHKAAIKARLAKLLKVSPELVNLKGKTHEKVDAVGEGRAVEAHVVVLLVLSGKGR